MGIILGCIADDFTGATDLANMLVKGGLRTVQLLGVPNSDDPVPTGDAIVVALKSRTISRADAVSQSLTTLEWLKKTGARQFFFKYCSTFDSTDQGNIGPVVEALMEDLDTNFTVACPAFPETGRTVFKGHLFVGDTLLSNSHMRQHPLTPMTDSNLVAVLNRQTDLKIGLVPHHQVSAGSDTIRKAFNKLKEQDIGIAITDAIQDEDLLILGEALSDFQLITGGSGIAIGLPDNYRKAGLLNTTRTNTQLPPVEGPGLVLSGSCSEMTCKQVEEFSKTHASYQLDPIELVTDPQSIESAIAWAKQNIVAGPVLLYASAPPEAVQMAQSKLGRQRAGEVVESAMAEISQEMVADGVRRLVVAGGETAGAVMTRLKIRGLLIGEQIDPGVPGTLTMGTPQIALALKSGNFGSIDFFERALRVMP
tara:strand:- start:2065 stop:3333 length:1269 start_codon:yes stop_codon:yes gene_type:complete